MSSVVQLACLCAMALGTSLGAPARLGWLVLPPLMQGPHYNMLQEMAALQALSKNAHSNPVLPVSAYLPEPLKTLLLNNFANSKLSPTNTDNNQQQTTTAPDVKTKPVDKNIGTTLNHRGHFDSVIIDAATEETLRDNSYQTSTTAPFKFGTRGVIGSVISAIPFLPFEVNVPDTISWFYNALINIISVLESKRPSLQVLPTVDPVVQENMTRYLAQRIVDMGGSHALEVLLRNYPGPVRTVMPSYNTVVPVMVE